MVITFKTPTGVDIQASRFLKDNQTLSSIIQPERHFCSIKKKNDHITPILDNLNWRKIEDIVKHRDQIKVSKALSEPRTSEAVRSLFVPLSTVSQSYSCDDHRRSTASIFSTFLGPSFILLPCDTVLEQPPEGLLVTFRARTVSTPLSYHLFV